MESHTVLDSCLCHLVRSPHSKKLLGEQSGTICWPDAAEFVLSPGTGHGDGEAGGERGGRGREGWPGAQRATGR